MNDNLSPKAGKGKLVERTHFTAFSACVGRFSAEC